jgi:hypothetical protein
MNTNTTLKNAVFNFAFTGVMQPHKHDDAERPRSLLARIIAPRKPQDD